MPRVAFYTFGILREPKGHQQVQGFYDRLPSVFERAESSPGFIASAPPAYRPSEVPDWGNRDIKPRFFIEGTHTNTATTLSLWKDLESFYAFSYSGMHREALHHRKEWFLEPEWPSFVAWWVDDDHTPTWEEGVAKLEYLHDHGSSAYAFNFKQPFDHSGLPTFLNRQAVQDRLGQPSQQI